MIGALAFEQGEEYLAAVLLLECSAISLFAAVFHWKGISQSPHLTKAGRLVVVAVSAILGLLSPVWILASKGDKTWSRLPHGVEIITDALAAYEYPLAKFDIRVTFKLPTPPVFAVVRTPVPSKPTAIVPDRKPKLKVEDHQETKPQVNPIFVRPGDIYPDPDAAVGIAPVFKSEAELVATLDAPLRKRAADRAEKMKEFEIKYQKVDRLEIDVDDSNPDSVKRYNEELARRAKEDEQREQQYSNDFQRAFADVGQLCFEITKRCEAKGINIDSNVACVPFAQAPTRYGSTTALTVAEALEGLARRCLN